MQVSKKAALAIENEVRHMDRLTADLLDASRIGAGRFVIQRERTDLVKLVRKVAEQQQGTTTKHEIVMESPETMEGWWDADRVGQVLTNLINNAIKYSPMGGRIRVQLTIVDENTVLRVSDQGIGIATEDMTTLFEPFSRLHWEQTVKGTGLGLYITKAIVEAHGGRIWAESPGRGMGSTFVVTLPLPSSPLEEEHHAGKVREELDHEGGHHTVP